jgi:hypothetical protein
LSTITDTCCRCFHLYALRPSPDLTLPRVAAPRHSGEPSSPALPPPPVPPSPRRRRRRCRRAKPVWHGGGGGFRWSRSWGMGAALPISCGGGGARRRRPEGEAVAVVAWPDLGPWGLEAVVLLRLLLRVTGRSARITWEPGQRPRAWRRRPPLRRGTASLGSGVGDFGIPLRSPAVKIQSTTSFG